MIGEYLIFELECKKPEPTKLSTPILLTESICMLEKIINLEAYSAIDLFGVNDCHLNEIKDCFPQLKIVARGDMLKVSGEEVAVGNFEKRFHLLLAQFEHFGKIADIANRKQIMQSEDDEPQIRS